MLKLPLILGAMSLCFEGHAGIAYLCFSKGIPCSPANLSLAWKKNCFVWLENATINPFLVIWLYAPSSPQVRSWDTGDVQNLHVPCNVPLTSLQTCQRYGKPMTKCKWASGWISTITVLSKTDQCRSKKANHLQASCIKQWGVLSKSLQKEVLERELMQNLSSDGKYRGSWILSIVCGIQQ